MAAMSEAVDEAETGQGLKVGVAALSGCRVVKSMMGTGTETGVSVFSWENGIGESAMAPVGYLYASSS
jgi:hypothetical protein